MAEFDLQHIALLIGKEEPSILKDYLEQVANRGLMTYKGIYQWGAKRGESLYTHILNGIFVLDTLRNVLGLSDTETRVLYTAYTIHDLNKVRGDDPSFGRLARRENIADEIRRLGLDAFFPGWEAFLEDILSLVRGHSGHFHHGGERWIAKRDPVYGLGLDRVNALLHLMRAADVVDLSHTLEERAKKAEFLGHLNAYLADTGQPVQYEFFTHRLTEQRGLLTNLIHNGIVVELHERYRLVPLLYYPDGVAYLAKKGQPPTIDDEDLRRMARRIAQVITGMTTAKFREFISSTGQGVKVDPKCLELGIPFREILREIYNLIQRRRLDPEDLDGGVRRRLRRDLDKGRVLPEDVVAALEDEAPFVSADLNRLRVAELLRSYYIFLNTHFRGEIADAWQHIYDLLELPSDRYAYYEAFDPRYDRAYVLVRDLSLSEEEVYRRIEADGTTLLGDGRGEDDPKTSLFVDYLRRYAVFSGGGKTGSDFQDHLAHYVENQHRQCVFCGGPFPTAKWMTADVRPDITVQVFSNRLRGGRGEPKKYVCAICHLQFLVEKLNYPPVRGEKLIYLHLFPYSFLTQPFIEGLRATVLRIVSEDTAVQALNLRVEEAIDNYLGQRVAPPVFRSRTQKGKPQPYGLYLPRYAETVSNLLIFPINAAGNNDTARFLFALWNGLVLQRHFGVKVLISNSPVPPLDKQEVPDLYVDNVPLACRGLLPYNGYVQIGDGTDREGSLERLWDDVGHLFALRKLTFVDRDRDPMPQLIRALAEHPLAIFHVVDRLLLARVRGQEPGGLVTWLGQQAFPHVRALALSKGGERMSKLSTYLRRAAEIAWKGHLRGRTLERSSLVYPVAELFAKLSHAGGHADLEVLKAAAVQDIFDHLYRIAEGDRKPGRKRWEAIKQFVDVWFDDILGEVYEGNLRKMLADEKLLRSAYLFYVQEQIPQKGSRGNETE